MQHKIFMNKAIEIAPITLSHLALSALIFTLNIVVLLENFCIWIVRCTCNTMNMLKVEILLYLFFFKKKIMEGDKVEYL